MYSIRQLHYGFKRRIEKVDTSQKRNFLVPQVDDFLNEGLTIYMREISKAAEYDQTRLDDLRQLTKVNEQLAVSSVEDYYISELPEDYYRYLSSLVEASKGECNGVLKNVRVQLDDLADALSNPDYKPSFEYRQSLYTLVEEGIIIWHKDEFTPTGVRLNYIKKHPRLGNPQDSRGGSYKLPDGVIAAQQDLVLDSTNQPEAIMDIAVLCATIDSNSPEFEIRLNKILNINKL